MPPRAVNFKAGSIIYFEGDKANSVYLLKDGKINLALSNLQSGDAEVVTLNPGEFFGVKSGMISFPREETAKVITNSMVLEFPIVDFEALISKNTQIIIKMLKVFSNQLRKIHRQVQSLVSTEDSSLNPAENMFLIGDYFFRNRKYTQAMTVYNRFLKHYPSQELATKAQTRLKSVKSAFDTYGDGGGPVPMLDDVSGISGPVLNQPKQPEVKSANVPSGDTSEAEKLYGKGISLIGQQKHAEAYAVFKQVVAMNTPQFSVNGQFEMGKCLFAIGKYEETIKHFKAFIDNNSGYDEMNEINFMLGVSYAKSGDIPNAKKLLNEVIAGSDMTDTVNRKASKVLKELS